MAVTHADLAISPSCRSLGSKLATCVMLLCAVLGLLAFVFGLVAEITRTEAIWILVEENGNSECMYTSNGWSPVVCALGSLLALGMAMGIGQAYMWMALCTSPAHDRFRPLAAWTVSDSRYFDTIRWQAAASFVFAWIFFAVAAVLLIIGIVVETEHTRGWSRARNNCMVVRIGVFAAAGVFGLFATCMSVAFYVSAVQTEKLQEEVANVRLQVIEAAMHYTPSSPPSSTQLPNFSSQHLPK